VPSIAKKLKTLSGSGTILAALRYQVPLIVVPNTTLLDNHQEELAVAMEQSNYLIRGDVKYACYACGFRL
jgi:UDP-N-acetylglucosamine transferase subunit ALG13